MSDARQPVQDRDSLDAGVPARRGIFQDPLVRTMSYVAVGLVVVFVATVVGALATGVISSTGPRTRAEKEVAVSGAAVLQGSTDPAVWGDYISSLIASGQYSRATDVIAQGKASIDDSATAELTLGEARLASAQGDFKQAIDLADKAMKRLETVHNSSLAAGGLVAKGAVVVGLPDNYYAATLLKAYAYRDMSSWGEAIKQFDIYIAHEAGAADILVDRANVKIKAGDKEGAEKDFRTALKYIPDSTEALAGLESIGATR
jgi:tetratricopeptide (TPR) repeat protein